MIHRINSVGRASFHSEIELDNKRRRYALQLGEHLEKIGHKLKSDEVKSSGIKIHETKTYNEIADELTQVGIDMQKIANEMKLGKLAAKIDAMERTCNKCHMRFEIYE